MAASLTTTTMSSALVALYERQLLARAMPRLVHSAWGTQATYKGYNTYNLRRYSVLEPVTTALTEGVTPTETAAPTITTVQMEPSWYGAWLQSTDKLLMTAYDPIQGLTAELLGEQAALSVDRLTRTELVADATADYAGSASADSEIDATNDKITFAEYIYQVASLDAQNARALEGGDYVVVMHPYTWATLMQDTTFLSLFVQEGGQSIRDGYMGRILRTRIYVTSEAATTASTTTVYHTLFLAWNAYGLAGFTGLTPNFRSQFGAGEMSNYSGQRVQAPIELIMFDLGETGFDPLKQRSTTAWKLTHDAEVLNANWIRDLHHATVASA